MYADHQACVCTRACACVHAHGDAAADVNVVDGQRGATPLDFAGEVKDAGKKAAVLAVLVEYSLHAAANAGNLESVKALITKGHDVNAKDKVSVLRVRLARV